MVNTRNIGVYKHRSVYSVITEGNRLPEKRMTITLPEEVDECPQ